MPAGDAPSPQGVERYGASVGRGHEGVGNHGVRATRARKAGGLGKRAAFDGNLVGSINLVDRAWNRRVGDIRLVGGVEQDQRAAALGKLHEAGKLLAGQHGAGRVVRIAQVQEVHRGVRQIGHERVAGVAGQGDEIGPRTVFVMTESAGHGVGVDVRRVNRVGHRDARIGGQQFGQRRGVGLRAVGDENFVPFEPYPKRRVVRVDDGLAQKRITLIGRIAVKSARGAHFARRFGHRAGDRRRQWLGHVADAQTDDRSRGRWLVRLHAARDFGEQVVAGHGDEVGIESHLRLPATRHRTQTSQGPSATRGW